MKSYKEFKESQMNDGDDMDVIRRKDQIAATINLNNNIELLWRAFLAAHPNRDVREVYILFYETMNQISMDYFHHGGEMMIPVSGVSPDFIERLDK